MSRSVQGAGLVLCWALLWPAANAQAAKPSETLLPSVTKGYMSVPNFDVLEENWNKTQLGQLMQDPVMKPFTDDLRRQLQEKWSKTHHKLGLSWDDMRGVPSGEFSIALVQPSKTEAAVVLLADVADHLPQANELLKKVEKNMAARQAKRTTQTVRGTTVIVYNVPKKGEIPAEQAYYFLKDDLLGVCDHFKVLDGILGRVAAPSKDNLAALPAYEGIMARCKEAAGEMAPHARWFVEPFGYVEASRIANPPSKSRKGTDYMKILKNQGFTAVQGIGGFANFAVDEREILHRVAIWAPPVKPGPDRYELAARMLDLPNGGKFDPPAWVPREIAMFTSFNWNMKNAFEASKTLVNEIVGDEVFEDVLKSILEDPNGPRIDIRKDLVGHLGNHAIVISDYQLPITPKSERLLFAAESTNPQDLAAAIEKSMKTDPDARRRDFNGHVIWEIVDEETALPMITIENSPIFGEAAVTAVDRRKPKPAEEKEQRLPNSAITVAHGHLLVATHIDFLMKVLTEADEREQLGQSVDYRTINAELDKVPEKENSLRLFSRTDEVYRAVYELIRAGRMPEAETMLGRLLNSMLGDGKDTPRTQQIDGSKLPDFETVRRYFGPAGLTMTTEQNGWFITAFVLSKEK